MNIKYYLRGLGTGIAVTTIILSLVYMSRMTDSKIIEKARSLGMVMYTGDKTPTEETTKKIEETTTEEKTTQEQTTEEKTAEETTTEETTTEEKTTQEQTTEKITQMQTTEEKTTQSEEAITKPVSTEPNVPSDTYTIAVSGGMTSKQIAIKLYEAGVIDDASKFDNFLVYNGYSKKIEKGIYTFTKGSSYEEIAKVITK